MESELTTHLRLCADAYGAHFGLGIGTMGRRVFGDHRFFVRLESGEATFTVRKYDRMMQWFSTNWPADLDWPDGVPRPAPVSGDTPVVPADCPPAPEGAGGAFPEAAE